MAFEDARAISKPDSQNRKAFIAFCGEGPARRKTDLLLSS
jgi:hypothetical protein